MWWSICKLMLLQQRRALSRLDQGIWLCAVLFLAGVQIYIYREVDAAFRNLPSMAGGEELAVRLFAIAGFAVFTLSLFLFYLAKGRQGKFLSRLPLSPKDLFRAQAFPVMGLLWVLFMAESASLLIALLRNVALPVHPVLVIVIYGCYAAFCLQGSYLFKTVVGYALRKFGYHRIYLESAAALAAAAVMLLWALLPPQPGAWWNPQQWLSGALAGSLLDLFVLLGANAGMFLLLYYGISGWTEPPESSAARLKTRRFHRSMILNGIKLEMLRALRDWRELRILAFSLFLGNLFVFIAYLLFDRFNQAEYFHFLIIALGSGIAQTALYPETTERAIRRMPLSAGKLLAGKTIYGLAVSSLLLSLSFGLLLLIGVELAEIPVFRMYVNMWLFISAGLCVHSWFHRRENSGATVETLLAVLVYALAVSAAGSLPAEWLTTALAAFMAALLCWLYVYRYKKRLETERITYDLAP